MNERAPVSCPKCGEPVDSDSKFCKHCAFDLTKPSTPVDQASADQTLIARIILVVLAVAALVGAIVFIRSYTSTRSNSVTFSSAANSATPGATSPATVERADAGPPDSLIKSLVQRAVPSILNRTLDGNGFWVVKSVSIASVDIVRRGEFHPNQKVLLVQARVRGTLQEEGGYFIQGRSRKCQFDGTNEFRVYRNDYGDWLVQQNGFDPFAKDETCDQQ